MRKILIFGGTGSLGNELCKRYINTHEVVVCSRDEAKHWKMKNAFKKPNLRALICDVREPDRVQEILLQEKPEIVIIAQAQKQIDICEIFPEESVKTNILGTMNIVHSLKNLKAMNVYKPNLICFISTDKSANPISVYGMCKSISEKLLINLSHCFDDTKDSKIILVRYGNVLSSTGSIIPLLLKQAKDDETKSFTLTHPLMTRFMMKLEEAVQLIDTALLEGQNGDLWVPKLPSMKILDLIEYFSHKYNKPYNLIGIRGVEKIDEIMLTREEALKATVKDKYFVVSKNSDIKNSLTKEYSSSDFVLSKEELSEFLDKFLPTVSSEEQRANA